MSSFSRGSLHKEVGMRLPHTFPPSLAPTMSAPNAYQSSAITFTFPDDPFCGRVNDSTGAVVYQLYLEQGFLGGKKSSSISRIGPKGNVEPVGEISWGGWTSSRNIVIGGIDCGRLLVHRSSGWFSPAEYWFTAGDGREYYWKRKEVSAHVSAGRFSS